MAADLTLSSSKMVLRATVLAQAVAILLALAPGAIEDRWFRFGLITLFVQWVALLSLLTLSQLQKRLTKLSQRQLALLAFSILLTWTFFISLMAYNLLTEKGWNTPVNINTFIIHNLLIAIVVGFIGLQFYLMHLERNQRIAAQSRAELDALQARIRPHFLFNSLNTAAELTQQDPKAAEQALLHLSDLFRAALKAGEDSDLKTELALVDAYLSLEQWRLGNRLQINKQYPSTLPHIKLPSLTLQPLVENAIRHGVERMKTPSSVAIQMIVTEKHVTIIIENPTEGKSLEASHGNGIAIENIKQRLALIYDDTARLTTGHLGNTFRAKLVIPYKESPNESINRR